MAMTPERNAVILRQREYRQGHVGDAGLQPSGLAAPCPALSARGAGRLQQRHCHAYLAASTSVQLRGAAGSKKRWFASLTITEPA